MAQPQTRVLTAHVPATLAKEVDKVAVRIERTRAWIIKQALMVWLEQEKERDRLTYEALAEVDAGRVIDHAAVRAWADSLLTDNPLQAPHEK